MNNEANKSWCEAMQSSVNNGMESLCTIIEAKMTEVNDTISQVKKDNQSELSKWTRISPKDSRKWKEG